MTNQQTPRQQTNGRAAQPAQATPQAATPQPVTPPAETKPAPAPATFSEAPSSINLRFDYKGYEGIQLTLRDVSGSQLLHKLDAVLDKLEKMGATPATGKRQAAGQAGDAPAGGMAVSGDAPPVCKYHGPMKPSRFKGWYCPARMGDGTHCKETHD